MKILINTPDYSRPSSGGVASYYYGMRGYWNEDVFYNVVGRRKCISGMFWMPWDILKFCVKLWSIRPDCVVINPSLQINALKRDFAFLRIAKAFGFETAVLIHGFDLDVASTINKRWVVANLNESFLVMTLAEKFRRIMLNWGVTVPIELVTTKVEDRMLDGYDVNIRSGKIENILFLSRMERAKGIYETIDTFSLLKQKHPGIKLKMVGSGSELNNLQSYVVKKNISDVIFTGALDGEDRLNAYKDADLFLFLSSYGEGMPTVVLEAMAFGLPIVTRNVGGLCDFFENKRMGVITDSQNPSDIVELVEPFFCDKNYTKMVSLYNHEYAINHFLASEVGRKVECLIHKHLSESVSLRQ